LPCRQVAGYVIATFCMFVGLVIIALPITIIGANFDELYRELRKKEHLRKQVRNHPPAPHLSVYLFTA
jgi:hypothetical protein